MNAADAYDTRVGFFVNAGAPDGSRGEVLLCEGRFG